uniref:RING-type E3 ubiquitin transferase n=1 Tax=Anthurium amnicola TaxID=1678845 RepID=A0A1D1YKA5_9ARAE
MQGQRSTVQFFPEAFDFDHASGSSSSGIGQQLYWNNELNPCDTRSMPDYLLSRIEANMSHRNLFNHETESPSRWNLGGSGSSEPMMNQVSHDGPEMENVWTYSSTTNSGTFPIFEERRLEAANMLSLDSGAMNLNSNQIAQGQLFMRNSSSTDSPLNLDCSEGTIGNGSQVPQTGICPFCDLHASEVQRMPSAIGSSNSHGISTGDGIGYLSEDADDRPVSLLDNRRLSGKRKNIEGVPGSSSGSSSNVCFQQTENTLPHPVPARYISSSGSNIYLDLSKVYPPEEHFNRGFIDGMRGTFSECLPSTSATGASESSQRNYRLRINSAQQVDSSLPNLWPPANPRMNRSVWSPHQSSSLLVPVNQPLETRPAIPSTSSQNQSHLLTVPGLTRMLQPLSWNAISRIGSSSNSHMISGERSVTLREANLRGLQRNSTLEHPMFVPVTEVRRVAQDPMNWSVANGNISIPRNVASTSLIGSTSGVHPSVTPTWTPLQSPHSQYQQTSSEFVYWAFPAASDPGAQLNNFIPQRSGHSSSSEIAPQPGAGLHIHQQPSSFLMGRRSNVMGAPLTSRTLAAMREGRNMMMLEHLRNSLDLISRGESTRFEDVLILDESAILGAADLHDRHRDMRLDIDDMSYEELLALEERIGSVSTGLSEEIILKHLKQWKYLPISLTLSDQSEPCCICQEEYLDGDDLGELDCGHDFHTTCIKQWLVQKNACPICKKTALASS